MSLVHFISYSDLSIDLFNLTRFLESINTANWFLCGDLVKLFAVCPMNPARLKENVEVNQVGRDL